MKRHIPENELERGSFELCVPKEGCSHCELIEGHHRDMIRLQDLQLQCEPVTSKCMLGNRPWFKRKILCESFD